MRRSRGGGGGGGRGVGVGREGLTSKCNVVYVRHDATNTVGDPRSGGTASS